MTYDIVTAVGASAGDLSNGVENANVSGNLPGGYARMKYFSGTVNTSYVNASSLKAMMCMVRFGSVVNDYSIQVKIGYHYY